MSYYSTHLKCIMTCWTNIEVLLLADALLYFCLLVCFAETKQICNLFAQFYLILVTSVPFYRTHAHTYVQAQYYDFVCLLNCFSVFRTVIFSLYATDHKSVEQNKEEANWSSSFFRFSLLFSDLYSLVMMWMGWKHAATTQYRMITVKFNSVYELMLRM